MNGKASDIRNLYAYIHSPSKLFRCRTLVSVAETAFVSIRWPMQWLREFWRQSRPGSAYKFRLGSEYHMEGMSHVWPSVSTLRKVYSRLASSTWLASWHQLSKLSENRAASFACGDFLTDLFANYRSSPTQQIWQMLCSRIGWWENFVTLHLEICPRMRRFFKISCIRWKSPTLPWHLI